MLKVSVDSSLFSTFPELKVTGFVAAGLDRIAEALAAEITATWAAARADLDHRGIDLQKLVEVPEIRGWRNAFAACGVRPSTFRSSAEALIRRLLKDGEVRTPFQIVNHYCAVSARYRAPIGVYDLDTLPAAQMEVRRAKPDTDRFQPLGGRTEDMPLTDLIPVYASANVVACYLFNHRDSRETCIRSQTHRAAFFSEAVTAEQHEATTAAVRHLASRLERVGATVGGYQTASQLCPSIYLHFGTGGGC